MILVVKKVLEWPYKIHSLFHMLYAHDTSLLAFMSTYKIDSKVTLVHYCRIKSIQYHYCETKKLKHKMIIVLLNLPTKNVQY